nr:unnamed protein product [Spirometra erinaceieuropaei]
MFSAMLMDAYRDERPGIRIAYRTDGHLLNQRRMHSQSSVSTTTVHELLLADDCALNTTSEKDMQQSMDLFYAARENTLPQHENRRRSRPQDFEGHCLRSILNLNRILETDVLERMGILSIYVMLRQLQLRWSGYLMRMGDERLPKRLFNGDVATGSRSQEGQIRRYKDTLKSSPKRPQINPTNWDALTLDQPTSR